MLVAEEYEHIDEADDKERNQHYFPVHDGSLRLRLPHKKERKEASYQKGRYGPAITIPHKSI